MNPFSVFSPHVLFIAGTAMLTIVLAPFVVIAGGVLAILLYTDWKSKNKTVEYKYILGMKRHQMTTVLTILCAVLAFAGYSLSFLSCSGPWLRAKPTKGWENRVQGIDTAIVLGFGIEKDDKDNLSAGKANRFLLAWTIKNTGARTLLVQEGTRLAALETIAKGGKPGGQELVMIHPHDESNYVDTLQAARFALRKMKQLGKTRAVLVAHDLQLERASWDFAKVKRTQPEWQSIEIIIPRIPKTPFPGKSRQWHTRGGFRYKFIELFWSRPRDYLAKAKTQP